MRFVFLGLLSVFFLYSGIKIGLPLCYADEIWLEEAACYGRTGSFNLHHANMHTVHGFPGNYQMIEYPPLFMMMMGMWWRYFKHLLLGMEILNIIGLWGMAYLLRGMTGYGYYGSLSLFANTMTYHRHGRPELLAILFILAALLLYQQQRLTKDWKIVLLSLMYFTSPGGSLFSLGFLFLFKELTLSLFLYSIAVACAFYSLSPYSLYEWIYGILFLSRTEWHGTFLPTLLQGLYPSRILHDWIFQYNAYGYLFLLIPAIYCGWKRFPHFLYSVFMMVCYIFSFSNKIYYLILFTPLFLYGLEKIISDN